MNICLWFSIALFCACAVGGCQGEQYADWTTASTAAATSTTQRPTYPTYLRWNGLSGSHPYRHLRHQYPSVIQGTGVPYPSRHPYPSYHFYPTGSTLLPYLTTPRYPRFHESTQVVPMKQEGTETYYSRYNSSTEVEDRNSTIDYDLWGADNSTRDNDRWRELFNSTFYGPAFDSHDWRLSMTSTPSPSLTTDGSQLHSKPLSDRVVVEMPGSLAADQDLHFALSLVPMMRQRSLREKLGAQVDLLNYFRSKLRLDRN